MVVGNGKKSIKTKKCKVQQSSAQQQTSSSSDCLKDEVANLASCSVQHELHENPIELGYNSGDEYDRSNACNYSVKEVNEIEARFEKKMRKKGFIIKQMAEDGACLFRAVADQIYGDQDMHSALRKLCMDYMAKNSDYFSHYVTEDFDDYIKRKRFNNCHGNHVEIQAMSEMFNRPIEVYHYNCEPINIFQGCSQTDSEPIRLSYHQNVHYNSVVDPYKPTIGVGLGFPSFKPGLADKNLLEKAMRISEEHELEQVMLQDKMKMTDWEATNEAIEEQIARESYVEWLRENERKLSKTNKKVKFTATATATTTSRDNLTASNSSNSPKWNLEDKQQSKPSKLSSPRLSPRLSPHLSPRLSPKAGSSGLASNAHNNYNNSFIETGTFVNQFPPAMFGMCWEDDGDILRQVLAQSQQEYLDSLKRKAKETQANETFEKASSSGLCQSVDSSDKDSCSDESPNKKQKTIDSEIELKHTNLETNISTETVVKVQEVSNKKADDEENKTDADNATTLDKVPSEDNENTETKK